MLFMILSGVIILVALQLIWCNGEWFSKKAGRLAGAVTILITVLVPQAQAHDCARERWELAVAGCTMRAYSELGLPKGVEASQQFVAQQIEEFPACFASDGGQRYVEMGKKRLAEVVLTLISEKRRLHDQGEITSECSKAVDSYGDIFR
jgi:hypothetical protein